MKATEKIFEKTKTFLFLLLCPLLIAVGILLYGGLVWLTWNGVVLVWNWIVSANLSTISYWRALGFGLGIPAIIGLFVLLISLLFEK